ncbi:MAG: methyltransferase domain-containing protein [Alphaproteobacteria bacterium]|nr:methyltransferase domain-containing protein [Alphaproteobacteria bacterium]
MDEARLLAARRLNFGLALGEEGDWPAAAEAIEAACALAPDYAAARFAHAEALEKLGRGAEAVAAFRRYLALEPDDRMGAAARLALLEAAPTPERLPPAYVAALFDDYAPRFESALRDHLDYRAPELIADALTHWLDRLPAAGRAKALDLGCGTGLVGRAVRLAAGTIDGIDLSERMLKRAAASGLYRTLIAGDIAARPLPAPDAPYDLVVAGDALNYLGALDGVFAGVAEATAPGALFLFTLEAGERPGYALHAGCRYAHREPEVRAWLQSALFETLEVRRAPLRRETGRWVQGLVIAARRIAADRRPTPGDALPPRRQPGA